MCVSEFVLIPVPKSTDFYYYIYHGRQSELVGDPPPPIPSPTGPPAWVDLRDTMPYQPNADHPQWSGGIDWAIAEDKTAITIHHIGVEAATIEGVAAWTTRLQSRGGKGLPRLQYHFCIERNGVIKYTTDLRYGFWHDHGGYPSHNVSVVFAGRCDTTYPPEAQLHAAAHLVRWLMAEYEIDSVRGHREVSGGLTVCPGWTQWEDDFRQLLNVPVAFALEGEVCLCPVFDLE